MIYKLILISSLALYSINKLTFKIRLDTFYNEDEDLRIILYWWSYKNKCRMSKIIK